MRSTSDHRSDRELHSHKVSAVRGLSRSMDMKLSGKASCCRRSIGERKNKVDAAPDEADRTEIHGKPSTDTNAAEKSTSSSSAATDPKKAVASADAPPLYSGVLVGLRVLKSFDGDGDGVAILKGPTAKRGWIVPSALFVGTVVDYRPPSAAVGGRKKIDNGGGGESSSDVEGDDVAPLDYGLYRVIFDDGDVQDMEPEEVYDCAVLYHVQRHRLLRDGDALTKAKGRSGRSNATSRIFIMGADQRNKRTGQANLKDGENGMLRHANPPLLLPDLKALDEERDGYWLEYKAYNLQRGVARPASLVDIDGDGAGWNEDEEIKANSSAKESDTSPPAKPSPGKTAEGPHVSDQPKIITPPSEAKGKVDNCDGMPELPLNLQHDPLANSHQKSRTVGPIEGGGEDALEDRSASLKCTSHEPTSDSHPSIAGLSTEDDTKKPGMVERTDAGDETKPEGRNPSLKGTSHEPTSPSHPSADEVAAEGKANDNHESGESRPVLDVERISTSSVQIVSDDESRFSSPLASPAYDPVLENLSEGSAQEDCNKPRMDSTDPHVDLEEDGMKAPTNGAALDRETSNANAASKAVDRPSDDDRSKWDEEMHVGEDVVDEDESNLEDVSLDDPSNSSKIVSDDEMDEGTREKKSKVRSMKDRKRSLKADESNESKKVSFLDSPLESAAAALASHNSRSSKGAKQKKPMAKGAKNKPKSADEFVQKSPSAHKGSARSAFANFGATLNSTGAERKRRMRKSKAGRARFPVLPLARKVSVPSDCPEAKRGSSPSLTLMPTSEEKEDGTLFAKGGTPALDTTSASKSASFKKQKASHGSSENGDSAKKKRTREEFSSGKGGSAMKPKLGVDSETETELDSDAESSLLEARASSSNKKACHRDKPTATAQPESCAIDGEMKVASLPERSTPIRKRKDLHSLVNKPDDLKKAINSSGSPVSVEMFDDATNSGETNQTDKGTPLKSTTDATTKIDTLEEAHELESISDRSSSEYLTVHGGTDAPTKETSRKNSSPKPSGFSPKLGHTPEYTMIHSPPTVSLANGQSLFANGDRTLPNLPEPTRGNHNARTHSTLSRHYNLGPGPARAKPHIHVILSAVVAEDSTSKSGRSSPGTVKISNQKKATANPWKSDNFLDEAQTSTAVPSPCMKKCQAAVSRFINPEYSYKQMIARDHHFSSLPNIANLAERLAKKFHLPLHDWSSRVDLVLSLKDQGRLRWPAHPSKDEMRAICLMVGLPGDEHPSPARKPPVLPFQSGGIVEIVGGDFRGKRGIVKWVMNEKVSLLVYQNGTQVEKLVESDDVRVLSEDDVIKSLLLGDGTNKQNQGIDQDRPDVGMDAATDATASKSGDAVGHDDFFDEFVSELFDNDSSVARHSGAESSKEGGVAKSEKENSNAPGHDEDFFSGLDHMLNEEVPELEDIFTILEKEVSLESPSKTDQGYEGRKGKDVAGAKDDANQEEKASKKKRGRPRKGASSRIWGELGELTVLELRECLRELGYKATGSKMELLKRLHAAYVRLDKGLPVGNRMRR